MIIWKGLGILAVIIPFGIAILCQLIFGHSAMYSGIGYTIGGILIWILGKRLHTNNEIVVTDSKTGEQKIEKNEHSLFWIKMELWAPVFILLGLSFLMSNLTNGKSENFVFPLLGIMVVLIVLYTIYQKRNNLNLSHSSKSKTSTLRESKNREKQTTLKSSKLNADSKLRGQSKMAMTEEEKSKKLFYEELRHSRNKDQTFKSTDHSKYMPQKPKTDFE